ncbi:ATP-binding cassette domain-containing protein [Amycolatopsis sp. NPDC059657]|uniref:ATP-binding cassette domain-containing protein n=1 Tax=Amycolatopsis sp. NPDC059657 TaxID=3346899 RepID=UPI00366B5428
MRHVWWLLLVVALVLCGGLFAGVVPDGEPWATPAAGHPLGTDVLGRDVLARVLTGGAGLLAIALPAGFVTTAAGALLGLAAARGAGLERIVARISAGVLMIPAVLVVLICAAVLSYWSAVAVVMLLFGVPMSARVVYATARPLRRAGFVEAAVARGERPLAVVVRELLPAVAGTVLADLGLRMVTALQLAVSVTVLGLGPQPPSPDWALMLRENLPGVALNPWSVLAPAAALALLATALTLGLDLIGQNLVPAGARRREVTVAGLEPPPDFLCLKGIWHGGDCSLRLSDGLAVSDGRVLGITGASGSGKTSLLRLLLGDLPPATTSWRGQLWYRGVPLPPGSVQARRWRRDRVGVLGQDPVGTLDPLRRIGVTIADGGSRWPVEILLARLGLPADVARRYPHQLSGGEAQRVALARAVARDPAVLVLDEPTSGLDPATLELVTAEVVGRRRPGRITVVVSHDRDWLARIADDVLELTAGQASGVQHTEVGSMAGAPVFRAEDLELREGELVVLMGRSGSGKTTLLRALAGRTAGCSVLVDDGGWAPPRRGVVELLGQDQAGELNPARTLADTVGRPLRVLRGVKRPRARAVELLGEVGLGPEFAGRRPGECSGGQRQRAGLARALAAGPRVLLADEPTSALDSATAAHVLDVLDRCRRAGMAVLLVTHDERIAARADRVLTMEDGKPR